MAFLAPANGTREAPGLRSQEGGKLARLATLTAFAGLIAWAVRLAVWPALDAERAMGNLSLGQFKTLDNIHLTMGRLVGLAGQVAGTYAPLGALASVAFRGWVNRGQAPRLRLCGLAVVLTPTVFLFVMLHADVLPLGPWANVAPASIGAWLGLWTGSHFVRGWRGAVAWISKVLALVAVLALGAGGLALAIVEFRPPMIDSPKLTSAEKRRLFEFLKKHAPQEVPEGQIHTASLTERDLDLLLAWWLSIDQGDHAAKLTLENGRAGCQAAWCFRGFDGQTWHIPLSLHGDVQIEGGHAIIRLDGFSVGRLTWPQFMLDFLARRAERLIEGHEKSKAIVESVRSVHIRPNELRLTYGHGNWELGSLAQAAGGPELAGEALQAAIGAQVCHLLKVANEVDLSQPDDASNELFRAAFGLARTRSLDGDPAVQNRAALFALGAILGYPGFRPPEELEPRTLSARQQNVLNEATFRGRVDWRRHFLVSAAISALGGQKLSDAIGLFKEELDAGNGGSGFSFADLLADRAGTRFAGVATRDAATAQAIQKRLADGLGLNEYFPDPADLPEGIPDKKFEADYGGVGGAGYRRLVDEIDRRIRDSRGYEGLAP